MKKQTCTTCNQEKVISRFGSRIRVGKKKGAVKKYRTKCKLCERTAYKIRENEKFKMSLQKDLNIQLNELRLQGFNSLSEKLIAGKQNQ